MLIYNDGLPPTKLYPWTTLSQLCPDLWDSQSRLVVIQPGIKLGSVVTPLALRCSALDRCTTREICVDSQIWGRVSKHFCSIEGPQGHSGLHF